VRLGVFPQVNEVSPFVALKKQKDEEFSAGTAIGQRAAL
jgi:hypothetical protein